MSTANAAHELTAETTEDRRRRPQVNPGGASRVSGVIHIGAKTILAINLWPRLKNSEPGLPTRSRLLMHPLAYEGGVDYAHNGPRRWRSMDDPEWQMLAAWVRGERTGSTCPI